MVGPSARELLKINNRMTGVDGGDVAAEANVAEKLEWEALAGHEMEKDGKVCLLWCDGNVINHSSIIEGELRAPETLGLH